MGNRWNLETWLKIVGIGLQIQIMYALPQPLELDFHPLNLSDEQFYQLCVNNPELTIERTAKGVVILMSPVGGDSGSRELGLGGELYLWNKQRNLGRVFSSSTMFRLPGGGDRSPDAAWVEESRWQALSPEDQRKFPPIAPDFVIELRSSTDSLKKLQVKMQEYMDSGVRLGWLFNPSGQTVEIYRSNQEKEVISLPAKLSGEDVLPGFLLQCDVFTGG